MNANSTEALWESCDSETEALLVAAVDDALLTAEEDARLVAAAEDAESAALPGPSTSQWTFDSEEKRWVPPPVDLEAEEREDAAVPDEELDAAIASIPSWCSQPRDDFEWAVHDRDMRRFSRLYDRREDRRREERERKEREEREERERKEREMSEEERAERDRKNREREEEERVKREEFEKLKEENDRVRREMEEEERERSVKRRAKMLSMFNKLV